MYQLELLGNCANFNLIEIYEKTKTPNCFPRNKPNTIPRGTWSNNDEKDKGIRQTWLFAHPDNKKFTGPYEKFRIMIYGQQYKYLMNHSSHKIKLMTNSPNTYVYRIEILTNDKQLFFYEWHVQKGSDDNCKNCWFTSAVSQPVDQGNTI